VEDLWVILAQVVDRREAIRLSGASEMTWTRLEQQGDAPPVTQISPRRIGYRLIDLIRWLDKRRRGPVGMEEIRRAAWLKEKHDNAGIKYPLLKTGAASFQGGNRGWMTYHPHPLPKLVAQARKYDEAANKFLGKYILEHIIDGRIYAGINPHRGEHGEGAVTGRFSYDNPPLQQMPKHNEELAPKMRRCFLPEEGEQWVTLDASQQELRLMVHFGELAGFSRAKEAGDKYRSDPTTDFHQMVADMTGLPRKVAKTINFANTYGAGIYLLSLMLGKTEEETRTIKAQYNRELPFIKELSEECQKRATERGYLVLYGGARRHWPVEDGQPVRVYRAMNSLIQGSAARHTKLWMRACWNEKAVLPRLQLHDALECSVADRAQAEHVRRLGREVVSNLTIPMLIDANAGPNWGEAKEKWE
jgi:DNA polymerase I-like protein with 3'-5' exonuclease and polymerase domains